MDQPTPKCPVLELADAPPAFRLGWTWHSLLAGAKAGSAPSKTKAILKFIRGCVRGPPLAVPPRPILPKLRSILAEALIDGRHAAGLSEIAAHALAAVRKIRVTAMQRVMWTDLLARKPGMSLAEYSRYYLDVHGAIALAGKLVQIRRYVQNHRIDQLPSILERIGLGDNGIDSVAQIWLDDQAAILEMIAMPGAQALLDDERNFMDLDRPRSPTLQAETMIAGLPRGAGPDGFKLMVFARRQATFPVEAFRDNWLTAVVAGTARALGATRHIVSLPAGDFGYDDAAVERIADPRGTIDGVSEIWIPSLDAIATRNIDAWRSLVYPAGVDPARTQTVLVQEHILVVDEPESVA